MDSGKKSANFPFSGIGTLLLSDLAGFSVTSGDVSPIDMISAMGRIRELEGRSIQDSGGFMPYTGVGEVMLAVWGPLCSSPSHADIALRLGRTILAESKKAEAETGLSLQVRIAVTTGKVTVDFVGRRPQVVGDPLTTARRLLELEIPRRSHLLYTSETLQCVSDHSHTDSIAVIRGCSGQDVPVFEFVL